MLFHNHFLLNKLNQDYYKLKKNLYLILDKNPHDFGALFNISIIKNQSKVPVIVDAGIGCASDAAIAMELGCDGVLINTAVAEAKNPILMAEAMKDAVIAGRKSFISGRIKKRITANPSSPFEGLIEWLSYFFSWSSFFWKFFVIFKFILIEKFFFIFIIFFIFKNLFFI